MNPPSMEVIFLLLSGVILVAGVLYWFWSHLQLTQKKVQLLENAVFELRTMLLSSGRGPPEAPVVGGGGSGSSGVGTVAASGYEDLGDDDWDADGGEAAPVDEKIVDRPDDAVPVVVPSVSIREVAMTSSESGEFADALQPGGRILVPSVEEVKEISHVAATTDAPINEEQFRALFASRAAEEESLAATSRPVTLVAETLESMPVKELRRLAQERGIAGAADMRKKDILTALRQQIPVATPALDLTKLEEVATDDTAGVAEEVNLDGVESMDGVAENPVLE